jgi:hypothetical protein
MFLEVVFNSSPTIKICRRRLVVLVLRPPLHDSTHLVVCLSTLRLTLIVLGQCFRIDCWSGYHTTRLGTHIGVPTIRRVHVHEIVENVVRYGFTIDQTTKVCVQILASQVVARYLKNPSLLQFAQGSLVKTRHTAFCNCVVSCAAASLSDLKNLMAARSRCNCFR